MIAETSLFQRRGLQLAFLSSFKQANNGKEFKSGPRRNTEMANAVRAMLPGHPELNGLVNRLGAASVGFYLGTKNRQENGYGWAMRAIVGDGSLDSLEEMLRTVDPMTSRARHIDNFNRARRVVSEVIGLHGRARARLLGRLSRQFHGAPGTTSRLFRENRRPRFTSAGDIEQVFDGLSGRHQSSDERFLDNFDRQNPDRQNP